MWAVRLLCGVRGGIDVRGCGQSTSGGCARPLPSSSRTDCGIVSTSCLSTCDRLPVGILTAAAVVSNQAVAPEISQIVTYLVLEHRSHFSNFDGVLLVFAEVCA